MWATTEATAAVSPLALSLTMCGGAPSPAPPSGEAGAVETSDAISSVGSAAEAAAETLRWCICEPPTIDSAVPTCNAPLPSDETMTALVPLASGKGGLAADAADVADVAFEGPAEEEGNIMALSVADRSKGRMPVADD